MAEFPRTVTNRQPPAIVLPRRSAKSTCRRHCPIPIKTQCGVEAPKHPSLAHFSMRTARPDHEAIVGLLALVAVIIVRLRVLPRRVTGSECRHRASKYTFQCA
jgi:hypothetical protein